MPRSVFYGIALHNINFPRAEKPLLKLLQDQNEKVRDWSGFVVYQQEYKYSIVYDTLEIRTALLALTDDPVETVFFEALISLGVLQKKRVARPLRREPLGSESKCFFDLVIVADRLYDPTLVPALKLLQERFIDEKRIVKRATKQASALNPTTFVKLK